MKQVTHNFIKSKYLHSIDLLRGLAALYVVIYHFVLGSNLRFVESHMLREFASYGHLGVQVFFVISGFVIPYSMFVSNYEIKNFKLFMAKRLLRLEPPYLISVLLSIALIYISTLSPYYRGEGINLGFKQVIFHLAYLNSIFGYDWVNVVYWTLAIEFQYYLLMAVLFPLLKSGNVLSYSLLLVLAIGLSLIFPQKQFLLKHLPFFILGISMFLLKIKSININKFMVSILFTASIIFLEDGLAYLFFGIAPVVIILFTNKEGKLVTFLSTVSYSIYLLHIPIGQRIMNLGENFISQDLLMFIYMVFAILVTILISYIFSNLIEKPSMALSKKIKYQSKLFLLDD